MSITLYREGLPRVSISSDAIPGREGMLVGFATSHYDSSYIDIKAILMLEDGTLTLADFNLFRIQFHYDAETDQWTDENERDQEQE